MPLDYEKFMWLYARRGIAHWKGADEDLRRRAKRCLGPWGIAEDNNAARAAIRTIHDPTRPTRLMFIPMPKYPKSGIERCFFLPLRETKDGTDTIAFELFLLVARTDGLAFRIEPAHSVRSAHGYGHVQSSQAMLGGTVPVQGLPGWYPDSYPAFPVLTADPLEVFLWMATAVHGYKTGLVPILEEIFQAGNLTPEAPPYFKKLEEMLA
jgi:hypothetical protein